MTAHDLGTWFEDILAKHIFPMMGIDEFKRVTGKLNQSRLGDFRIKYRNRVIYMDAKAEQVDFPNFPIELLQDYPSLDLGWYYRLYAEEIWYGRFDENTKLQYINRIDLVQLRNLPATAFTEWNVKKCGREHGNSIIVAAPWEDLVELGVSERIWTRE